MFCIELKTAWEPVCMRFYAAASSRGSSSSMIIIIPLSCTRNSKILCMHSPGSLLATCRSCC